MIKRSFNHEAISEIVDESFPNIKDFEAKEWLSDKRNIALTDGSGNFTLYEYGFGRTFLGHYFLKERGREALRLCKEFLHEAFTGEYNIDIITGLTPVERKGALWMNRQLGFTKQDIVDTVIGPCQMVSLTKQEYLERTNT